GWGGPGVGREEAFLRGIHRRAAPAEVEQQPLQAENGLQVGHVETEVPLGDEKLRGWYRERLIASKGRQRHHREILALDKSDSDGRLACALPCDTSLRVHALRDVDQLRQIVLPGRIDGGLLRWLERCRVSAEVGSAPWCRRSWSDLPAEPLGQIVRGLSPALVHRASNAHE